jgi:hypothetical protein
MVHTRSGAGSEPLTLPESLEAAAAEGVQCPVCFETRSLCCTVIAPCGHGVCIGCAPNMLYEDFTNGRDPSCPVCRCTATNNFFAYILGPDFRERAIVLLRRISSS